MKQKLGKPHVFLGYHGRTGDFSAFSTDGGGGKTHGTGAFFSSSPAVASAYAGGVNGGNVVPALVSLTSPALIDARGKNWNRLDRDTRIVLPPIVASDWENEALLAELEDREPVPNATIKRKAMSATLGKLFPDELVYEDDFASTDDMARWARQQGYDGLVIRNVVDCGPSGVFYSDAAREPADLYVAYYPSQIRFVLAEGLTREPHVSQPSFAEEGLTP